LGRDLLFVPCFLEFNLILDLPYIKDEKIPTAIKTKDQKNIYNLLLKKRGLVCPHFIKIKDFYL